MVILVTTDIIAQIRALLPNPQGQCYPASEALYHILGGKSGRFTPMVIHHEGITHWYLRDSCGGYLDPTADQFDTPVPYEKGRGCGFLTKLPSRRAQKLLDKLPYRF